MTILISTDLHMTDKPRDNYRFGLFDFLVAERAKHKASLTLILGDITDLKDNHSSKLVNTIVDGIHRLAEDAPVIILKGNHDYLADPDSPFFDFLNYHKNIRFVTTPLTWETSEGKKLLLLPHIRNEDEWDNFRLDTRPDYAFIHQTVTGAISETGRRLDGYSLKPLKRLRCPVFAGDVHKPHTIGPVTYIGPPYHIKFGDNFEPRCAVLNQQTGKLKNIYFECPRKWSLDIDDPDELLRDKRLRSGDQVKVNLELHREDIVDWPAHKERISSILKQLGLQSFGIELKVDKTVVKKKGKTNEEVVKRTRAPQEVFGNFCKSEKLSKAIRVAGKKIMKD